MADHTIVGRSLSPDEKATLLARASQGRTQELRQLLEEYARTHCRPISQLILDAKDSSGLGIVHKAAETDRRQVIRMICDDLGFSRPTRLAILDMQENGLRTAASIAAERGHDQFLRDLIQGGANVLLADWMGGIPLHRAAMHERTSCMRWLIETAPHRSLNMQTVSGQTPLHMSLALGDILRAGFLIRAGTNVNLQTAAGDAALHMSVRLWSEDNPEENFNGMMRAHFRRLFEAGADLSLRNGAGRTPLQMARDMGHHKAAAFIIALVREGER
ncbi:hypothetical protein NKR19_g3200 [Coniochaeta hoffmannii]|uniref:Ankyrin n=1 Tax=Coniochaeta hoffmannii TaxID=91930 RepID=A0AA38S468_9PEZI|nr:hypothetical protein NKR19_g3200 [Coniochaeta hoffmannii]